MMSNQNEIDVLALQYLFGLLIDNNVIDDFVPNLFEHGLHIVGYDHVVLNNQNFYGLFQNRWGLVDLSIKITKNYYKRCT